MQAQNNLSSSRFIQFNICNNLDLSNWHLLLCCIVFFKHQRTKLIITTALNIRFISILDTLPLIFMLFLHWQSVNQNYSGRANSYFTEDLSSILYHPVNKPVTKRLKILVDDGSYLQEGKGPLIKPTCTAIIINYVFIVLYSLYTELLLPIHM